VAGPAPSRVNQQLYVGQSVRASSTPRFLRGRGAYVDDLLAPPGSSAHALFVRSPHPHAAIRAVDDTAARVLPGVLGVFVGDQLGQVAPTPVVQFVPGMRVPAYLALSTAVVRYVGEPVAVVVAETRAQAEDAAALVDVAYEPLPAVATAEAALAASAPVLHPELGGDNVCYRVVRPGELSADDAFARAAHVVRVRVAHHRIAAAPLEPRGLVAHYDSAGGELVVQCSSQTPHQLRDDLATALGLPHHRVRVIVPDVGGGFGLKGTTYREDVAVALLAVRLGRTVRWTATRGEDFVSSQQARDQCDTAEAALDAAGHVLALRTRTVCNLGAYALGRSARQALRVTQYATGAYSIPAHHAEAVTVFTNTTPTGAYRGAGRPEAAFVIERLMDAAARQLELDPAELRRRNFLRRVDFPHTTPNGASYDSGDYPSLLERLLLLADYEGLRARQRQRRAHGELVGLGLATFIENTAAGWESGAVRVEPDGSVAAISGAVPMGQGVETVLSQMVADALGITPEEVRVRFGDTALTQAGMGSFGSRSTALAGGALLQAAERVRDRAAQIAGDLLEAAPTDLQFADGGAYVRGAPRRRVSWQQIAGAAYPKLGQPVAREPGLEAHAFFSAPAESISAGAYLALVSIERATGRVQLEQLIAVDDCGRVINPVLVQGQVHGAMAQGIGEALFERVVYAADGQALSTSLLDYALPRARDTVSPRLGHQVTPSPYNPLGAKGAGEAGIIGTPPAIINAVIDALAPLGVRELDPPAHPEKIWRILRDATEGAIR